MDADRPMKLGGRVIFRAVGTKYRKRSYEMYWFRYQPLKDRLSKRLVSDREALPYLLFFSGLEALALSLPASSEMNRWDIVETVLYVFIAIAGVSYVYRRNGGSKGYDIIQKFVVLGWVVAMRYLMVALPVGVLVYIAAYYYGVSGDQTTLFDVIFFNVISAFYYERLGRHISDTNERNGEQGITAEAQGEY